MNKFCIVTPGNFAHSELMRLTNPNRAAYAQRHGYEYRNIVETGDFPNMMFARWWHYFPIIQAKLFDHLLICDTDYIFTNHTQRLEQFVDASADLIITKDKNGLQCGVFLLRCCDRSAHFARRMIQEGANWHKAEFDQSAMEQILKEPEFSGMEKFLPQRQMQGYESCISYGMPNPQDEPTWQASQWKPGDFGFHAPGMPVENKIKILSQRIKEVVQ